MSVETQEKLNTAYIKPNFPETQKITKRIVKEVLDLLSGGVKEKGPDFVYYEKRLNTLLNMEGINEVKVLEVRDWGEGMVIDAQCKAKKEFIKEIRKNILATKVTGYKNDVRIHSFGEGFKDVRVNLYGSRVQLFLRLYEQE